MKKFTIIYSPKAYRELKDIDKHIAIKITDKIEHYVYETTNPLDNAKPLVGVMSGLYRYRVGDYRVIFEVNESGELTILLILTVKHRKDIYR